jgi:hypothetical protein
MRFAIVTNASNAVVREFEAPDDYAAPSHKFGSDKQERVVRVVEVDPPALEAGQELQRSQDELTETELRRGWVSVAAPVPQEVPMWAFRLALEKIGMLDPVLAFIQSLPHDARREAETHLEYGNYIRRDHPLMAAAAQLGLDSAKVDDIFRVADELKDGVADFGEVAVGLENSAERKLWNRVKGWVSELFGGG